MKVHRIIRNSKQSVYMQEDAQHCQNKEIDIDVVVHAVLLSNCETGLSLPLDTILASLVDNDSLMDVS